MSDPVVFLVDGVPITASEIRKETAALRAEAESEGVELPLEARMELRQTAIENLMDRILLLREAVKSGMTVTDEEVQQALAELAPRVDGVEGCRAGMDSQENLEDIANRLRVDKLRNFWLSKAKRPKKGEAKAWYLKNRETMQFPAAAHAMHILKQSGPEEVEALRARILAGEDFAAVASEGSDCRDGCDLGWFTEGTMVDEFDAVAFKIPLGEVSEVFETPFGFHCVKVLDRRERGVPPFEDVEKEIEDNLWRASQEEHLHRCFNQMFERATIEEVGR